MRDFKQEIIVFVSIILLAASVVFGNIYYRKCHLNKYEVEITFCDSRPKKIVIIEEVEEPNYGYISTYKRAVPEYYNYINVCDVKVLRILNK